MEKSTAIALKGCRDGVRIIVSPDADIREVLDSLHEKIREYKSFFKGSCDIIITGREFSSSDKLRINSILSTILPECAIKYENVWQDEEKKHKTQEQHIPDIDIFEEIGEKTQGIQKAILKFFGAKDLEEEEVLEEENYQPKEKIEVRGKKSDNSYIFKGDVKSNNRLRAAGDLIIVGDIEADAEVIAIGNIYVFGRAEGKLWAGCNGDDTATIIAYELKPEEMRISDVYLRLPNRIGRGAKRPEKAHLLKNTIYIDEYL